MVMVMGKYLMGAGEIGERLGVSRQRVQQLAVKPNFPKPYDELQMGKVWLIADIEAWVREYRKDLVDVDSEADADETPSATPSSTKGNRTPRKKTAAPRKAAMRATNRTAK